jgi:ribose 5-phosphate isomerase B
MVIHLATDHAGFELKEKVKQFLLSEGYEVNDCGAYEYNPSDDYPDFMHKAAEAVSVDPVRNRAIIFGGSGQGEAMEANKHKNVRAAVYYAPAKASEQEGGVNDIIKLSREHNDANILSLGARFLTETQAIDAVKRWLGTPFSNEERHERRIKKMH